MRSQFLEKCWVSGMNEYCFQDLTVGLSESFSREIRREDEDLFRLLTGDENPLHRDDGFAVATGEGKFRGHVVFGMLTASLLSTMAGVYLPGKYSLIHTVEVSFIKPVYAGDVLTVTGTVTSLHEELQMMEMKVKMVLSSGVTVCKAKMKIILQK